MAIAIRVRFFARLRELAGIETESLQLSPGSTLADVYAAVYRMHSGLPDRGSVRGAVNQELADWTMRISDGDEVAFIPPVSGGARCDTT